MKIPFVDLKAQYSSIKDEIDGAIQSVINRTSFIGGDDVREFEELFADYCGTKHCIAVGNGTDALFIALKSLGIKKGDGVVTVPNTFIATTEAITLAGGKPFFVDIDEQTFNLDPLKLESLLKDQKAKNHSKIKAVVPVHLYGQPCDMTQVVKIARKYNAIFFETSAKTGKNIN